MALSQMAVLSEREGGQVTLRSVTSNVDGVQAIFSALPAGFGDCYIIRASAFVNSIATMMVGPEISGPFWLLGDAQGADADHLWTSRWTRLSAVSLAASHEPLIAPLWRDGELFFGNFDEVDINAVPTADVTLMVLVQRRRNMGTVGQIVSPTLLTS